MRKTTFVLLAAGAISCCTSAMAQTPPPPSPFEQHKAAAIAHLQAHIAREQALLSCVQAAQNHAALKACKRGYHAQGH